MVKVVFIQERGHPPRTRLARERSRGWRLPPFNKIRFSALTRRSQTSVTRPYKYRRMHFGSHPYLYRFPHPRRRPLTSLNCRKPSQWPPSPLPLPERPPHPPPLKHPLNPPRARRLLRRLRNPLLQAVRTGRRRGERLARRPTHPTSTRVRSVPWFARMQLMFCAVLKQVHPDTGISNKAMAILNSFVNDIFERIATEASSE